MKTQNPWMGRAKGSAGGMTASKIYNKNVLKAKAFEVNNPNTAAQQNQRTFFKEVSDLVNQLTEEQCRFLCPKAPKGMSRRNFLSKQLASYVTTSSGQKVVDLANVNTLGNAKEVEFIKTNLVINEDNVIVSNDNGWPDETYEATHQMFVLLLRIQEKKLEIKTNNDLIENNGAITFDAQGKTSTNNFNAIIFSVKTTTPITGFGTMGVSERPAR